MNTKPKYYVYEHIRPDTGAVFYVGKGRGYRATTRSKRNAHWQNVVKKANGVKVRYLAKDITEELAFLCEAEAIDKYRRLGVYLVNKTDGGEGSSGYTFKMSEDHKNKISAAKTGVPRPIEMVEKMRASKKGKLTGAENPFFGKRHTEKTKELLRLKSGQRTHSEQAKAKIRESLLQTYASHGKSKPVYCITNGQTYFSINDAARRLGLHRRCVTMVCNKEMHHTAGYKFEWSKK